MARSRTLWKVTGAALLVALATLATPAAAGCPTVRGWTLDGTGMFERGPDGLLVLIGSDIANRGSRTGPALGATGGPFSLTAPGYEDQTLWNEHGARLDDLREIAQSDPAAPDERELIDERSEVRDSHRELDDRADERSMDYTLGWDR